MSKSKITIQTRKRSVVSLSRLLFINYLCAISFSLITNSESRLMLSPSGVVLVCPGVAFTTTCNTDRMFINWIVTVPPPASGSGQAVTRNRLISSSDQAISNRPLIIGMLTFNISITSTMDPFTSDLSFTNVTADLNNTEINCSDVGSSPSESRSSVAIVHVIAADHVVNPPPLNVTTKVSNLGIDDITITLSWIQHEENSVSYSVSVVPQVTLTEGLGQGSRNVTVTIPYNTPYIVSIVANLCGRNVSSNTTSLNYVKCYSVLNQIAGSKNGSIRVNSYRDPALEGTTITLECSSPHLVLTGPNTTMCMENGEWDPDPRETKCIADCGVPLVDSSLSLTYNSTQEGSEVLVMCDGLVVTALCHRNGSWSPQLTDSVCNLTSSMITESTVEQSLPSPGQLPLATISSISVIVAILLILVGIIMLITVVMIRKRSQHNKISLDIREAHTDNQQTIENESEYSLLQHPTSLTQKKPKNAYSRKIREQQRENESEYSLLQQPIALPQKKPQKQTPSKDTGYQSQQALVYADIGPLSAKRQPCISTTLHQDDQMVEYSQLNFKAHKIKSSQPEKTENRLDNHLSADTLLNLDSLLIQLQAEVTPKWYQFGKAIGMNKETLNKYTEYSDDQCIIEVLDFWLRNHTGQPTWREVAGALRGIDLKRLAADIEKVYETGKLPKEVNMDELPLADSMEESPPPIPPRCS